MDELAAGAPQWFAANRLQVPQGRGRCDVDDLVRPVVLPGVGTPSGRGADFSAKDFACAAWMGHVGA